MKGFLSLILLIAVAVIFAGCIETKQEITLNPDGSGKVIYQTVRPLENFNISMQNDDAKKPTPEEKAEKEVKAILEHSDGIDAWMDVSYKINDLGKLEFKGTAYFKSINDVKIGGTIKSSNNVKVETSKDAMTVTWAGKLNKKPIVESRKKPENLTEAQINKQIQVNQARLKQMQGMMSAMLTGFKDETVLHLPGKITDINNMQQVNDNTAELIIEGDKILKIMKEFSNDKQAMRQAIEQGENIKQGPPDSFIAKKMFGEDGDVIVKTSGELKPQFDYEKEVGIAKKAFPELCTKLGLEVEVKAPVALPKK